MMKKKSMKINLKEGKIDEQCRISRVHRDNRRNEIGI